MSERDLALAQILALAEQHGLTHDDVRAAFAARKGTPAKPRPNVLGRVFAYIGGAFVLAGVCIFVGMFWEEMGTSERIVATLGPGLSALALAYMASLKEERRAVTSAIVLVSEGEAGAPTRQPTLHASQGRTEGE